MRFFKSALTIEQRVEDVRGRSTGFDYLRLVLSISVMLWHSVASTYGESFSPPYLRIWGVLPGHIVPMFFALSGFLVAGSLLRCRTVISFLGLRVIRIFPALTVEVFLSALLLGPFLTSLPLSDYFSSSKFHIYFLNVIGDVHFNLPGVFLQNPNPGIVNGQLWTVPYELYCYIAITVLAVLGIAKRPKLLVLAVFLALALGFSLYLYRHGLEMKAHSFFMPRFALVICFLSGVLFHICKRYIIWDFGLFVICAVASLVLMSFPPLGCIAAIIPLTYVTIYLGLCNPRKFALLRGADYSYGIFLYGYAVQQAYIATLPLSLHTWYWNIAFSLPTAAAVAALSWHFVERPALGARKHISLIEDAWLKVLGNKLRKQPN